MSLKRPLDSHFNQIADTLGKHAAQGRVFAVPLTTKPAAEAAEKIIRDMARAAVQKSVCNSFRKHTRYLPLKTTDSFAPVYGVAVFSDKDAAHKFALHDLARHQLKIFELHGGSTHRAAERLKSISVQSRYHLSNGFHAG